jgi:glyoxylase-like metal-dependent hydrolase (beta-lactamase superfamily II)
MKQVPFHAGNPGPYTGDGNWTYLIPGAQPVMIDAGVGNASHLDAIAEAAPSGPGHVIVTHAHSDHASGAPAILKRWPGTTFSKYPWPGQDGATNWNYIDEGATIATGEGDLQVLHTPGHSPDHLALWHPDSKTLFVGDMMQVGSSVFIPASKGGNLAAYLHSLRRLLALQPKLALPSHGPAIDDPVALINQYLDHRHQREVQVLNALESGVLTVDDITKRIYPNLTQGMLPLARESVLAHLHKLVDEGQARQSGDQWTVTN